MALSRCGSGGNKILRDSQFYMGEKTVSGTYVCQYSGKLSVYMGHYTNLNSGAITSYSVTKNGNEISASDIVTDNSTYGRMVVYHFDVEEGDVIVGNLSKQGQGDVDTFIYFDMIGSCPNSKTFQIDNDYSATISQQTMSKTYTCQHSGKMSVYLFGHSPTGNPSYGNTVTINGNPVTVSRTIKLRGDTGNKDSVYGRLFVYHFDVEEGDVIVGSLGTSSGATGSMNFCVYDSLVYE